MSTVCSWCGVEVGVDEGFRAAEPEGERKAAFCRLEHVVPWAIQGAHWDPGRLLEPGEPDDGLGRCAHCGGPLGDRIQLQVRSTAYGSISLLITIGAAVLLGLLFLRRLVRYLLRRRSSTPGDEDGDLPGGSAPEGAAVPLPPTRSPV